MTQFKKGDRIGLDEVLYQIPDFGTKPDKYKHCALSCVMTLYCGPTDSMSVGIMKEIFDALGFGTPDWKDIEADKAGIRIGMKQISNADFSRDSCYRSCSTVYR